VETCYWLSTERMSAEERDEHDRWLELGAMPLSMMAG
jgi:hypothetical protein